MYCALPHLTSKKMESKANTQYGSDKPDTRYQMYVSARSYMRLYGRQTTC